MSGKATSRKSQRKRKDVSTDLTVNQGRRRGKRGSERGGSSSEAAADKALEDQVALEAQRILRVHIAGVLQPVEVVVEETIQVAVEEEKKETQVKTAAMMQLAGEGSTSNSGAGKDRRRSNVATARGRTKRGTRTGKDGSNSNKGRKEKEKEKEREKEKEKEAGVKMVDKVVSVRKQVLKRTMMHARLFNQSETKRLGGEEGSAEEAFEDEFEVRVERVDDAWVRRCYAWPYLELEVYEVLEDEHGNASGMEKRGVLPVDISPLLGWDTTVTASFSNLNTEYPPAPNTVGHVQVTVSVDKPLLSAEQLDTLHPVVFHLRGCEDMPGNPDGFEALRSECQPVWATYRFFDQPPVYVPGVPQQTHISWEHRHLVFLGGLPKAQLHEYLLAQPMTVEIHDRERKHSRAFPMPWPLGERDPSEPEFLQYLPADGDEDGNGGGSGSGEEGSMSRSGSRGDGAGDGRKSSRARSRRSRTVSSRATSRTTSRRSKRNGAGASSSQPGPTDGMEDGVEGDGGGSNGLEDGEEEVNVVRRAWMADECMDPYAEVPIWLSNMTTNQKDFVCEGTLVPSRRAGAAGDINQSIPGGYLEACSSLTMRVEMHKPVELPKADQLGPLTRCIYIVATEDRATQYRLLDAIYAVNGAALEIADADPALLAAYELDDGQREDSSLDVITGVQVADDTQTMFLLEGLADAGIAAVQAAVPREVRGNHAGLTLLANSQLRFNRRLYADMNVELHKIKLEQSASEMLASSREVYLRHKMPSSVFDCLVALTEIPKLRRMDQVVRRRLLPTCDMLVDFEKRFGMPLDAEDEFATMKHPLARPRTARFSVTDHKRLDTAGGVSKEEEARMREEREREAAERGKGELQQGRGGGGGGGRSKQRKKQALDQEGIDLSKTVREERDYVGENMTMVAEASKANTRRRQREEEEGTQGGRVRRVRASELEEMTGLRQVAYYSGQRLNGVHQQQEVLRKRIESDHSHHYTYGALLSNSVARGDMDELERIEEIERRDRWLTADGFQTAKARSAAQDRKHAKELDEMVKEELRHPWQEAPSLHSTFRGEEGKGEKGEKGMMHEKAWSNATMHSSSHGFSDAEYWKSVHVNSEEMAEIMEAEKRKAKEEWERKVVVKDTTFRVHWTSQNRKTAMVDRNANILRGGPRLPYSMFVNEEAQEKRVERTVDKSRFITPDGFKTYVKAERTLPQDKVVTRVPKKMSQVEYDKNDLFVIKTRAAGLSEVSSGTDVRKSTWGGFVDG